MPKDLDRDRRIHAHPEILRRAREMRHDAAPAEQKLWQVLRATRLNGLKFRRQQPLCRYIADFFCPAAKLVIELDGDSHQERQQYDEKRTAWIQESGCAVIRFTNLEVFESFDAVLEEILRKSSERRSELISGASSPSPRPSPTRGEGEMQ